MVLVDQWPMGVAWSNRPLPVRSVQGVGLLDPAFLHQACSVGDSGKVIPAPGAVALPGGWSSVNPGVSLAFWFCRSQPPQLARGPLVISDGDTVPSSSIRSPMYGPACSLKMRTASWLCSGYPSRSSQSGMMFCGSTTPAMWRMMSSLKGMGWTPADWFACTARMLW